MENIVFAVWVSSRLEFSADDKRACFETAERLEQLSVKVRKDGLLSIEDEIAATHGFMKKALQLAIDSTRPEQIREVMHNWIIFGNHRGAELLKRIIIIEGVVSIVYGENPRHIHEGMGSFFGEDLYKEYNEFSGAKEKSGAVSLPFLMEDFWYNIKEKQMHHEAGSNLLEKLFRNLDNMALQTILRNIDISDCVMAAKGSSEYVVQRILNNVSHRIAQTIIEEMYYFVNIKLADTIAAQNKVLTKVKELEARGEIILKE